MNGSFCLIEETSVLCSCFKICGLEGAGEHLSNLSDNAEKEDFSERCGFELV